MDTQASVHRDRRALAPVTTELVMLCEIYVWNSREGLGCTIPQKCCDINPLQYWTCSSKDAQDSMVYIFNGIYLTCQPIVSIDLD